MQNFSYLCSRKGFLLTTFNKSNQYVKRKQSNFDW